MRRTACIGASVLGLSLVPQHAAAICGEPPPIWLSVHRGTMAPLDVRVAMTMPKAWRRGASLSIETAPTPHHPRAPATSTMRAWTTARVERVELTVGSPLMPRTAYEVWSSRRELLGSFKTGPIADTTPPQWIGIKSARAWSAPPPKMMNGQKVISLDPECGAALLSLETDALATDDLTSPDAIRYAVWAEPAKTRSKIDYETPPRGWVVVSKTQPRLAAAPGTSPTYTLAYGNSEDDVNDIELPTGRPLVIGVRAIDLAGNASAPSERTVP